MAQPSKKLIITIAVAILAVGVTIFITKFPRQVTYTATVSVATSTSALELDSDKDGLKDWEEGLWKTDPKNPDTDGDGTSDGEEIKLGRNPLVPNSAPKRLPQNDMLDTETVGSKINPETDQDLSDTDKFSRELFVKIVAAGQTNNPNPPTETDFKNFVNETIKNQVDTQKAKVYTAADFSVDIAETPEKIKAYGNALATIITTPPPQKLEYELTIVDRAEGKKDPAELKKLSGNIAAYRRIENSLLALTVPKSAAKNHIAFTNGVSGMAWSITGLSYLLTDPIKAIPGVSGYAQNFQNFVQSLHAFNNYFKTENVIFSPTDAGYSVFDRI